MEAAQEMIGIARDHGTERLWTKVHPRQRHVALFARANGMKPTGEQVDDLGEPCDIYEMQTCR
jgi:hypothetical protein